jgi:hypothetical protein
VLIPGNLRAASLTAIVGMAAVIGLAGAACQSPESFHRHGDAGPITSGSGATSGTGGATFGTGGGPEPGTGGDTGGTGGGASPADGSTGGDPGADGGARGTGGTGGPTAGGGSASGGAKAAGGATGTGSGGAGTAGRGIATGGAAGAGFGGGTAGEGGATSMTCPTCTLTLTYLPIGTVDGHSIAAEVHIGTSTPVPINRIAIKYWYTNETGSSDITTDIDYVGLSTGSALAHPSAAGTPTTAVTPARPNANTVTSITVPETMLLRPGTQLFVKFRIHQASFNGTFMMANDYSFGPRQTLAMPWTKITAYVGGVRAWGSEPP